MHSSLIVRPALLLLTLGLVACGGTQSNAPLSAAPGAAASALLSTLSVAPTDLTDETPQLWFVELSERPSGKGGSRAAAQQEKRVFREEARLAGVKYQERLEFDRLWNGLSVRVRPSELGKLKDLPGVRGLYPVLNVAIPAEQIVNDPELATALAQTGADVAQNELGLSGAGVKVAVMDTGIDLDHPDFAGRLLPGYDFVGDAYTGANDPVAGQDTPDDCGGHGTHVAGIIGARAASSGGATGVAPGALLAPYRVFGCEGSTQSDIMIQAMERVLDDGMQVLNMSIGAAFQSWPQYPTAIAASNLVDNGVVVTASIGNSGTGGAFSAGAPGVGDKVIGVASFDNTHVLLNQFVVGTRKIGYQPASPAPTAPTSGSLLLARTGTPATPNDGCAARPAGSLSGQAVLIRRGTCTFYTKAFNAQQAGAAAVLLYNNVAGPLAASVTGTPAITIPVVGLSNTDGAALNTLIAAGETSLSWTPEVGSFRNATGDLISSFSSYGLAADLSLKPDLGAPGGLIRSTWPLSLPGGGYNTISGTSMSSPHVAGAVALLLQARPTLKAADVRGLLQNTAEPHVWSGSPTLGYLDMVHRQGAGMINIVKAVGTTASVTPSKLSLGEGDSGAVKTQTLTVTNSGAAPVTYTLSHNGARTTTGNYTVSVGTPSASVNFSASTLTIPAGGSAQVSVTITPAGANLSQYGGYLIFTPQRGGTVLRVPYAGFQGDYQALRVLTRAPLLATANADGSFSPTAGPATFTFQNGDVPYVLIHFDHFARSLKMDVYDAVSGKPVHPQFFNLLTEEYLGRNSTTNGIFAYDWDGAVSHSRGFNGNGNTHDKRRDVPNGQYVIRLSVLKALGDESNPAHTETWTSPVITVARP